MRIQHIIHMCSLFRSMSYSIQLRSFIKHSYEVSWYYIWTLTKELKDLKVYSSSEATSYDMRIQHIIHMCSLFRSMSYSIQLRSFIKHSYEVPSYPIWPLENPCSFSPHTWQKTLVSLIAFRAHQQSALSFFNSIFHKLSKKKGCGWMAFSLIESPKWNFHRGCKGSFIMWPIDSKATRWVSGVRYSLSNELKRLTGTRNGEFACKMMAQRTMSITMSSISKKESNDKTSDWPIQSCTVTYTYDVMLVGRVPRKVSGS